MLIKQVRKTAFWFFIATMTLLGTKYLLPIVVLWSGDQSVPTERRVSNITAAKEALSMLRLIADDSGDLPESIGETASALGFDSVPKYLTKDGAYVAFDYFPGHSISDSPETIILKSPIQEADGTVLVGQLDGLVEWRMLQE